MTYIPKGGNCCDTAQIADYLRVPLFDLRARLTHSREVRRRGLGKGDAKTGMQCTTPFADAKDS